jgi:hypothetical protein
MNNDDVKIRAGKLEKSAKAWMISTFTILSVGLATGRKFLNLNLSSGDIDHTVFYHMEQKVE